MPAASAKPILLSPVQKNFYGNPEQFNLLKQKLATGGVISWNRWKRNFTKGEEDIVNLNFTGINLAGLALAGIDLSGVNLRGADFKNASLRNADLSGANMWQAVFDNADLSMADISRTKLNYASFAACNLHNTYMVWSDLLFVNFQNAKLTGANLSYSNLGGADLRGKTDLSGAIVTGVNTWNILTDTNTIQKDLKIESWVDPLLEVSSRGANDFLIRTDDIESALLLYNLKKLDSKNKSTSIKRILDAMTGKIVLLLGNFGKLNKANLKAIRKMLSAEGYVPVIFDFPAPNDRDMIETVAILAGLSCFVIADFTSPNSTPLEALLIISGFSVPFAPIIQKGKSIFPMFYSLKNKYEWVLDEWQYKNKSDLVKGLRGKVIIPCEAKRRDLLKKKNAS